MNNIVDNLYGMDYVEKFRNQKNSGKMERFLKLINFHKEDLVLDIGCGPGFLYDKIKEKVEEYTGIDPSTDFIREAKSIHPSQKKVFFYNESAEEHLDRKLKYNKIFLIDVTEHLSNKDFLSLIKACGKLLKPEGSIFIHTPNREYFLEKLSEKGIIIKQKKEHIGVRTYEEYKELINKILNKPYKINCTYLNHYVPVLKPFHFLSMFTFFGKYFLARLFIQIKI